MNSIEHDLIEVKKGEEKMKKIKQVIFASIVFVISFTCVMVSASENGFYETVTVTTEEEAKQKLEEQLAKVEEFEATLGECNYLDYSGEIIPNKTLLDSVAFEEKKEAEEKIAEYEQEGGYTTSITVTLDEGVKTSYKFYTLNGKVTKVIIDGEISDQYNGKNVDSVLAEFVDKDEDDYKIVVTAKDPVNTQDNGPATTMTEREAQKLTSELIDKGYTNVKYTPNTTTEETKIITSRVELSQEQVKTSLESENTDKEVIIKNFATESTPNTKTYENLSDSVATNKKQELESTNLYELVVKNEKLNKNDTTKIKTGERYTGNDKQDMPYTEPVFENDVEIGYKYYYYGEREEVRPADSIEREFLTAAQCQELKEQYSKLGYTVSCEKVTTTSIEESEDDKFYFNEDEQSTRTWSHLDLSVSQTVNFYNEKMEVVGSAKATLSDVSAYFYRGNEKVSLVYSSNASSDAGRLEYCQTNSTDKHCGWHTGGDGSISSVTNNDKITILATITYKNLEGKTVVKNVVLEGYLDNIFNVCRQNNTIGGGFDLKLAIAVDKDGNHIVNFTTEEVWTFNGSIEAEYNTPVLYDEYRYGKLYDVIAQDLDYIYKVKYVATDYTVSYNGVSSIYELDVEKFDKNFIIDGNRTTYTVTTVGVIKENNMCGTGDVGEPGEGFEEELPEVTPEEEEVVLPPHTDVEVIVPSYMSIMSNLYILPDKKRK